MSQSKEKIVCKPDEIELLNTIISNPLSNERLRLKAKAIILLNSGKTGKDTAKEFNTQESTIREWKKRFLQYGIDGLYDARSNKRPNVRKQIVSEPNVESLIKQVYTSQDIVRRALSDENIHGGNQKKCEIKTNTLSNTLSPSISGLYISDTEKVLAIESNQKCSVSTSSDKCSENVKIARTQTDHGFAKVISALKASDTSKTGEFKGKFANVTDFVTELTSTLCKSAENKIYLIVQTEDKNLKKNLRYPNVNTIIERDNNSWIECVSSWLCLLSGGNSDEIVSSIKRYTTNSSNRREPFIWVNDHKSTAKEIQEASPVSKDTGTFKNNKMTICVSFKNKDGIEVNYDLQYNDIFPQLSELSLDSPLAFARAIGKIEKGTSSSLNDVSKKIVEGVMNEVTKKKM